MQSLKHEKRTQKQHEAKHISVEILEEDIRQNAVRLVPAHTGEDQRTANLSFENIKLPHLLPAPFHVNQHGIFVLTSNFEIIVGKKSISHTSANINERNTCFRYWSDKNKLPALPYFGQVYYAGHLTQRESFLEIFLYFGRYRLPHDDRASQYPNDPFNKNIQRIIEMYLSHFFMIAYHQQPIKFHDYRKKEAFYDYMHNTYNWLYENNNPHRTYTPDLIFELKRDHDLAQINAADSSLGNLGFQSEMVLPNSITQPLSPTQVNNGSHNRQSQFAGIPQRPGSRSTSNPSFTRKRMRRRGRLAPILEAPAEEDALYFPPHSNEEQFSLPHSVNPAPLPHISAYSHVQTPAYPPPPFPVSQQPDTFVLRQSDAYSHNNDTLPTRITAWEEKKKQCCTIL